MASALAALIVLACSAVVPGPTATPGGVVPVPTQAEVEIGGAGAGFDAGAGLYAYTSDLAPQAALASYVAQLLAQGFVAAGTSGGWQLFRGNGLTLAVAVGPTGPPTDLLVRVAAADSTIIPLASSGSAATTPPTVPRSPGQTSAGLPATPGPATASPMPTTSGPPYTSPTPSPSRSPSPTPTASPTCPPPGQAMKSPSPDPNCLPHGQGGPKKTPPGQEKKSP